MSKKSVLQPDNRGMSLVELLVSLGVISIVLAMLAAILMNVLNVSVRTNSNVTLQNESQTTMNLVVDTLMGAKGLIYNEAYAKDPDHELVFFYMGELSWDGVIGNPATYIGDVIVYQKARGDDDSDYKYGELYLLTFDGSDDASTGKRVCDTSGFSNLVPREANFKKIVNEITNDIESDFPDSKADRKPYLMGKYVTEFEVSVLSYDVWKADSELTKFSINTANPTITDGELVSDVTTYYYNGPVVCNLKMDFEMEYRPEKTLTRPMDDAVTVRNRLPYIFLQPYTGADKYEMFYLNVQ